MIRVVGVICWAVFALKKLFANWSIAEIPLRSRFFARFEQPIVRGLEKTNLHVSISHSNDWAIAVACDAAHPIGVDLESISPKRREIMQTQLSESEIGLAASSAGNFDANLTCLWTAKEALSKALKTGMMTPFSLFEVENVLASQQGFRGGFKSFGQYRFFSFYAREMAFGIVFPKLSEIDRFFPELKRAVTLSLNSLLKNSEPCC